jgi:drug/metabolite transporter (DMT)-like permease
MQAAQPKDYVQLHFIVLLWGFTAALGVLSSLPKVELVWYRTGIASLGLAVLLYLRKTGFWPGGRPSVHMLATGIIIAAHWILFFVSAQISSISICLAGMATGSLWTAILEPILLRRSFKWVELVLGVLVISGLYLIYKVEFDQALGLTLAVVSAFLSSLFTVINSRLTPHHDHYLITFWEMVGANLSILLFFPLYVSVEAFGATQGLQLSWQGYDWLWIFLLAVVCTVYAYSISVELQRRLSAFTVNLTVNLEPVYGILIAVVLFQEHEKLSFEFFIGTAIILSAVLLYPVITRWEKRRQLKVSKLN